MRRAASGMEILRQRFAQRSGYKFNVAEKFSSELVQRLRSRHYNICENPCNLWLNEL